MTLTIFEEYRKLDADQLLLELKKEYYSGYFMLNGDFNNSGEKKGPVMNEVIIRDTLTKFNNLKITEKSILHLIPQFKSNISVRAGLKSSTKNENFREGKVKFIVSSLPNGDYATINLNITSVLNSKGDNLIVKGIDTIQGDPIVESRNEAFKEGKFFFADSNYKDRDELTIIGSAQVMIPEEFEVISFKSNEINVPKSIAGTTFSIARIEGSQVCIVSPGDFRDKKDFIIEGAGPENVRYINSPTLIKTANVTGYTKNLITNKSFIGDKDFQQYFRDFEDYLKGKPECFSFFLKEYYGIVDTIYIAKPLGYIKVDVPFSVVMR